ncbi:hypothetical protein SAMN05216169_11112, partial [Anoxybacillus pushchinoensis]
ICFKHKKGMVDHASIKPAKKSKSMSIHHGFRFIHTNFIRKSFQVAAVIMNTLIIRLNIHLRQLTEDFDELIVQPIFHHSNQRTLLIVNDNATNTFIQHIRRRLSILERPLITARGDGKSYIYSNFNIQTLTQSMLKWLLPYFGLTTIFV